MCFDAYGTDPHGVVQLGHGVRHVSARQAAAAPVGHLRPDGRPAVGRGLQEFARLRLQELTDHYTGSLTQKARPARPRWAHVSLLTSLA